MDSNCDEMYSIQCGNCKRYFKELVVIFDENESDIFKCIDCSKNFKISISKNLFSKFENQIFSDASNIVNIMIGKSLTLLHLLKNGFNLPILVENCEGLQLKVPNGNSFQANSLLNFISGDHLIDVIDNKRHLEIKLKIKDFVKVFESKIRTEILNCISLEVSNTNLSHLIIPPAIVNKLSWVENYWPDPYSKPAVSKYFLFSMKGSFVDFHIDFGGSSIWYHLFKGKKEIYLIKPTDFNLNQYEKWIKSENIKETYFGNLVDNCYKLILNEGETFFIPGGWIHAIYSPIDCIVIGGNFLHCLNVKIQIKINEMEERIKTPIKFRFPYFELANWYAAPNVLYLLQKNIKQQAPSKQLIDNVETMTDALKYWLNQSEINQNNFILSSLFAPKGFDCENLIKNLLCTLKQANRKIKVISDKNGKLKKLTMNLIM